MAYTLASRSALAAADGSPVNATAQSLSRIPAKYVAWFIATTTGSPTGYNVRAAIEASSDGGTTWNQVVRFADITNAATSNRVARGAGNTAAAEAPIGASALSNAQASPGVAIDTPWPLLVRAVTQLQALSGGTSPTVTLAVVLEVGS